MNCKAIPDYAKSFKKEYIFLLGNDESFSYLNKDLNFYDVERGSLKKRSGWIDKINIQIKKSIKRVLTLEFLKIYQKKK